MKSPGALLYTKSRSRSQRKLELLLACETNISDGGMTVSYRIRRPSALRRSRLGAGTRNRTWISTHHAALFIHSTIPANLLTSDGVAHGPYPHAQNDLPAHLCSAFTCFITQLMEAGLLPLNVGVAPTLLQPYKGWPDSLPAIERC